MRRNSDGHSGSKPASLDPEANHPSGGHDASKTFSPERARVPDLVTDISETSSLERAYSGLGRGSPGTSSLERTHPGLGHGSLGTSEPAPRQQRTFSGHRHWVRRGLPATNVAVYERKVRRVLVP